MRKAAWVTGAMLAASVVLGAAAANVGAETSARPTDWQRVAGLRSNVVAVHAGTSCATWSYAPNGTARRIYRGKGPFGSWRAFGPPLPSNAWGFLPAGGAVLVGTGPYDGRAFRVTSSGRSALRILGGAVTFAQGADRRGPIYAGGARFGAVWVSKDLGRHWSRLTSLSREYAAGVSGLVVGPRGRLVASVTNPERGNTPAGLYDGIYESLDAGRTWRRASDGLAQPQSTQGLWGRLPGSLVTYADGVHRWDEASRTWQPSAGLPATRIESMTSPRGRSTVYAGVLFEPGGAFVSRDWGRTFLPFGLEGSAVRSISTNPRGDAVYAVRARSFPAPGSLWTRFDSPAAERACRQAAR